MALFLDIDGTLVDIAETPDAVVAAPAVPGLLSRLADRLDGAVALLSGRTLADIDTLFPGLALAAAGVHGCEWRQPDGTVVRLPEPDGLADLLASFTALAAKHPGLFVESKLSSLAFHYRQNPGFGPLVEDAVRRAVADWKDLTVLHGKMVVEVKAAHADKGQALTAFMDMTAFRGRMPVVFGDDVTDEAAFAVVNALEGLSVQVGCKPDTAARYHVESVSDVLSWLDGLAEFLDQAVTAGDVP